MIWRFIFILLILLNIITIVFPVATLAYLSALAKTGVSGTEFAGLLLIPFITAGYVTLGLNLVLMIIYVVMRRPRRVRLVLAILVIVASGGLLAYIGISSLLSEREYEKANADLPLNEVSALISSCQVRSVDRQKGSGILGDNPDVTRLILFMKPKSASDTSGGDIKYANNADFDKVKAIAEAASQKCGKISVSDLYENYKMQDLTVDEATSLLQDCKVSGFYYTAQNDGDTDAEDSKTGILLAFQGNPIRIHIADRWIGTLVPIARAAQVKCPDLQFWHDGTYEQRDENGNWH